MKSFNFGVVFLLLTLWSCKNQKDHHVPHVNDTTLVLNQALSNAISARFMPDADALTQPGHFIDSILLTSNIDFLDLSQVSVAGQKFKVMEEQKILSTLKADSNNVNLPNYLIVSKFEKNDSGYYVQVQNLSGLPYGGGGSLGMYFVKKGDSLINVKRSASSIN